VQILFRESEGNISRAATKVERAFAGPGCSQPNQVALPPTMKAEALEIIDEVITGGNSGEEFGDFDAAISARLVITIRHRQQRISKRPMANGKWQI
jgi:hypothetical protein